MKITLITFYFLSPGVRFISSYLKARGYKVNIIFLPPDNMYSINEIYSEELLKKLLLICNDSMIIGISVLTNDYFRALNISRYLKKNTKAIIIWGGIHPTIDPESCSLGEIDYIYRGEGEAGLLEVVKKLENEEKVNDIDNICYLRDGVFKKNKLRPLLRNGEFENFQDFELQDHYIREKNDIIKVTHDVVYKNICHDFENDVPAYLAIFSRGCIHGCTYCCNNALNKLYSFEKTVYRTKSIKGIIDELKYILNKFSFIKFIYINDDNFFANNTEFLKEFASQYKKEIDIPFLAYGSPSTITDEKITILKKSGLREVHIGVQSGSERINRDLYKRMILKEDVIRVANLIHKFGLRGRYDFIFDNPYETTKDQLETARLILELPKPYIFQPFSLTFFPGTELYKKAKQEGKIFNERVQVFEKVSNRFYANNVSYLKLLCVLLPRIPSYLGKIMSSKIVVFFLHRDIFKSFYKRFYLFLYFLKTRLKINPQFIYKKYNISLEN